MVTQPRRRFGRAALVLLLQIALALALFEVALRLLRPHHQGLAAFLYDSVTATDYRGAESLDELLSVAAPGVPLRAGELQGPGEPGVYRVIAVGDSFTYGAVPLADLWTRHLEELLREHGVPVEVLNLGVPGTGVPFHLRLWEVHGRHLRPDLVILGFFVGNDFFDGLGIVRGSGGIPAKLSTVSFTFRIGRNLVRTFRGLEKPSEAGSHDSNAARALEAIESRDEDLPTFTRQAYDAIEAERVELLLPSERLEFELRFDRVARWLERLTSEVERAGARLLVVVIPDEAQVDPAVLESAAESVGRTASDYDLELPQRRLAKFFDRHGIDFIDLLPGLRGHGERLYRPRDTHWNRAGNRVAAAALARHILGESWLAGRLPASDERNERP